MYWYSWAAYICELAMSLPENQFYKMKNLIILPFLLFSLFSFSQDLKCKDFKTGTFYITLKKDVPLKMKIIRELNFQTEFILNKEDIKDEDVQPVVYELIEWIDECSFILKFDETKMTLTEYQKYINDNNGVSIQLNEINGRCCDYEVSLYDGKQTFKAQNIVCKE